MILVLTNSRDFTTDSILSRINSELPVFRFNIDLWADYQWCISSKGFTLEDPIGRKCEQDNVGSVYLRKLSFDPVFIDVPAGGSEDYWRREELMQIWLGIRDWAHESKRLALVKPSPHGRWNKIRQMKVAKEYFSVPEWEIIHRSKPKISGPVVVKTLGSPRAGDGGLMLVREVDPEHLSPNFPWFLQQKMTNASHDVTVAWVAGKIFAYEVCREDFNGDDVRLPDAEGNIEWRHITLNSTETAKINSFMERTGYDFGRLDFLRVNGELWFLEVNPNGQFAWLDPDGSDGLLDAVAGEILRVWESNK
jgi:hypothetical protein